MIKEYTEPVVCGDTQFRFTPDAGIVEGPVNCGVCHTEMTCTRNMNGPRGFAQAMSGGKSLHDSFVCPHYEELWHKQAVKLRDLARDTPSKLLADMFCLEANMIIATKQHTKEHGSWRYY